MENKKKIYLNFRNKMVKIDFTKKTIQLWPEEFQGQVQISSNGISYTNSRGSTNTIFLPTEWFSFQNSSSSSTNVPPSSISVPTLSTQGCLERRETSTTATEIQGRQNK